jgi:hypothetical protein
VARNRGRAREARVVATPPPPPNPRSLAVLGLILACVAGPVGVVVSVVALLRARRAGEKDTVALVGIIVGLATTAAFIAGVVYFQAVFAGQAGVCADLGPGVHEGASGTFTCPAV